MKNKEKLKINSSSNSFFQKKRESVVKLKSSREAIKDQIEAKREEQAAFLNLKFTNYDSRLRQRSEEEYERIVGRMSRSCDLVSRNKDKIALQRQLRQEELEDKRLEIFMKHKRIKELKKKEIAKKISLNRKKEELKHYNVKMIRAEQKQKQAELRRQHKLFAERKNDKAEAEKLAEEFKNEEYQYKRQRILDRLEMAELEKNEASLEIIRKQHDLLYKSEMVRSQRNAKKE